MPLSPVEMNNMDFHMPEGFYRNFLSEDILDIPYRDLLSDSSNIHLRSPQRLALTIREFRAIIDQEFDRLGLSLEELNGIRAEITAAKNELHDDEVKARKERLAEYLSPLYDKLIDMGFWPYDFTS